MFYVHGTAGGCESTDSVKVSTKVPPALSVSQDTTVSCVGSSVNISATGTGTWLWYTETDTLSTSSSITVSPDSSTTYIVQLNGTNGCVSRSSAFVLANSVYIDLNDSTLLLEGDTVTLAVITDGSSFFWNKSVGLNDSTLLSPICTADTTTTYTITVFKSGCSDEDSIKIYFVPRPHIYFTYSYPNLAVDFTLPNTLTSTYSWDFGDGGTSTSQNPTHTYAASGDYRVKVSVVNAFGTLVYTDLVIVRN